MPDGTPLGNTHQLLVSLLSGQNLDDLVKRTVLDFERSLDKEQNKLSEKGSAIEVDFSVWVRDGIGKAAVNAAYGPELLRTFPCLQTVLKDRLRRGGLPICVARRHEYNIMFSLDTHARISLALFQGYATVSLSLSFSLKTLSLALIRCRMEFPNQQYSRYLLGHPPYSAYSRSPLPDT